MLTRQPRFVSSRVIFGLPVTEAEIHFLPEAYRFFILNYVIKYGQHLFHNIYASRLQREACQTYLPQIGRLDVERLLRALSL